MQALCFQAKENVSVHQVPDPIVQSEFDAIVQVEVAGLCGSDLHPFFGRETGMDAGTVMGHEFVGRIVEVGGAVRDLAVGDRVCSPFTTSCGDCFYCRRGLSSRCTRGELFGWRQNGTGLHGGQGELIRVPLADGTLLKTDETFDSTLALLLGDNLSTAYFGASMAIDIEHHAEEVYAVVGCGNVGLLAIQTAFWMGAKNVVAVDPNHDRLRIAETLGAATYDNESDAILAVRSITEGRGADGVMEFVGLPAAQRTAYSLVRPGGRMSVIGCHCTDHFAFSPTDAYDKNLTYRTGRCPARSFMQRLPEMIAQRPMDLSWCVTHRFGIADAVEAYETFAYGKDACIKAVIEFG